MALAAREEMMGGFGESIAVMAELWPMPDSIAVHLYYADSGGR
jgi:hypothetical protein